MRTFALSLAFLSLPQMAWAGEGPGSTGTTAQTRVVSAAADAAPDPTQDPTQDAAANTGTDADPALDLESEAEPAKAELPPFYQAAPMSEVQSPTPTPRPGLPLVAVGGDAFCFVEDALCKASLIADFDVGVGLNVVGSDRGIDIPYTQWRVRGGFTVRPLQMARDKFHPWGVGLTLGYSQGSPQISTGRGDSADPFADVQELGRLTGLRIALLNQLWLSQKRNALHVDLSFGVVRSSVFDANGRFWGSHAELAVGWGGWASFFGSADFMDRDLRAVFGFRTHAVAAGPVVGLVLLGLLAGGAL